MRKNKMRCHGNSSALNSLCAIAPVENMLDFFLANSRLNATGAALAGED